MLRLVYILLLAIAAFTFDFSAQSERVEQRTSSRTEVAAQTYAEQWICCHECSSDMLRSPRSFASLSVQNNAPASQQVRHRGGDQLKLYTTAVPLRRAGHVTRIFEFDYFRSSLRVVYYLYALCRLRI